MLAGGIFYMVPQNYSNKFQLAFAHIFSFPLGISSNVSVLSRTQQNAGDTVPMKEYITLQNKYADLEQNLLQQRRELRRLAGLYNNYVGQNVQFIYGYIIPASSDLQNSELTIECRGTNGMEKGQFVLARDNSIIGRVTDVFPQIGKAKVRLITDSESKIAVKIDGLNLDLLMQGNGDNSAKIGKVSREEKIKEGQKVFALRVPDYLDSPMIVGTISKCRTDDKQPLLWEITVKPSWELEELKEVAIIIMKPPK